MDKIINSEKAMLDFGNKLGELLSGGEVIELVGDVGVGKTTFMKGVATGLGVDEVVQSPSFTIGRQYECRDNLVLAHYDFYRLNDIGIMRHELEEMAAGEKNIIAVEWGEGIKDVLPSDRLTIEIIPVSEEEREIKISAEGPKSSMLEKGLEK